MLAIIGGSGLYHLHGVRVLKKETPETPFGTTSAPISVCAVEDHRFLFIPRHGEFHSVPPSSINFRANVFALKELGATAVLSVSAVGSLQEEFVPGKFCFVTDFADFTKKRANTFFDGCVVHWSPIPLVCPELREKSSNLVKSSQNLKSAFVDAEKVVYVCIEGPRFSTPPETAFYRMIGGDIIGMTACPEVFLIKEAGMGYLNLAVITDYDCWKEQAVTVQEVMSKFRESIEVVKEFIQQFIRLFYSTNYVNKNKLNLEECYVGGEKPEWFETLRK
ncbi:MAG: MTAP family purine nucleoside phosphorylase [Deltaproteobacteria bacterium]|nr:MTAP family purine nucleoside phosphorylase [Deltaproteobacteria bacterium]MCX7952568.1 MTAP family purine nucleoside phosphorylase [Deltaproteobacteria bacterium]